MWNPFHRQLDRTKPHERLMNAKRRERPSRSEVPDTRSANATGRARKDSLGGNRRKTRERDRSAAYEPYPRDVGTSKPNRVPKRQRFEPARWWNPTKLRARTMPGSEVFRDTCSNAGGVGTGKERSTASPESLRGEIHTDRGVSPTEKRSSGTHAVATAGPAKFSDRTKRRLRGRFCTLRGRRSAAACTYHYVTQANSPGERRARTNNT